MSELTVPASVHPIDDFRAALATCDCYPPDVVPVPHWLPGTAAFSAGTGLWREPRSHTLPDFPFEKVMIVGNNLDSIDGFNKYSALGVSHGDRDPARRTMATWTGLYELLERAGIGLGDFSFTNVFVGLKVGPTNMGRITDCPTPEYTKWCRSFLADQVNLMRPRLVIVLGTHAARDVRACADPVPWAKDRLPPPGAVGARLLGWPTVLVPVRHTSMRTDRDRFDLDVSTVRDAWRSMST